METKENPNTPQKFYKHLAIYTVMNIFFVILDVSDGGSWWFPMPLLIWGFFLGLQAWRTFPLGRP